LLEIEPHLDLSNLKGKTVTKMLNYLAVAEWNLVPEKFLVSYSFPYRLSTATGGEGTLHERVNNLEEWLG
jgi:hypothetical protein